jgi:acyl carrier protein
MNSLLSAAEIHERFAAIVAKSLRIEPTRVTPDASLAELGAESLDLLEITMEAEDEFDIVMPQKDVLQMGQDVFGPGVLVNEGRLTEAGVRFLQRRMPESEADALRVGMPVTDVARLFQRVGTWVRVIEGLLEHQPRACPTCSEALSKAVAGRFKCGQCGHEIDLPAGDELNRRWVEEYFRTEHASLA